MTATQLRLVVSNRLAEQSCSCRTWGLLHHVSRDHVLYDFMEWARLLHNVQLKMLVRGDHVAICELLTVRPGQGRARLVMTEICAWADCAKVTLELTPSNHWGSDVERLTKFYKSLGFEPNNEAPQRFRVKGSMIRYPAKGRMSDLDDDEELIRRVLHLTDPMRGVKIPSMTMTPAEIRQAAESRWSYKIRWGLKRLWWWR